MKNLKDYITEGLFGFGGTKQGDFIKQLCSSIVGIGYIWKTYIKKFIKNYDGPLYIQTAFADGEKILYKSHNSADYEVNKDSKNLMILVNVGNKHYSIPFFGTADKNGEFSGDIKIGKDEQQKTLSRVFRTLEKEIFDDLTKSLKNWDSSHPNVKKLDNIMSGLLDMLRNKNEFLLKMGTTEGQVNTKFIEKLYNNLLDKYNK